MKLYQLFVIFLLLIPASGAGYAQEKVEEPLNYRMEQVYIFEEGKPTEYIFVLNGSVGFKSLKTLKNFVEKLPPGTTIKWQLSCMVVGDEPLRSSEKDMDDFIEFCKRKKINLILGRAG